MKKVLPVSILLVLLFLITSCNRAPDLTVRWEHPMYLGHNGYWNQRIPVVVHNLSGFDLKGDPFTFQVGKGKGKLPLAGVLSESIRLTNSEGEQLKCRVDGPLGELIERGEIPKGAIVTIPLENGPGEKETYYIYFGNDKAWAVGEYLFTRRDVSNGGFESKGKFGPLHWDLGWPEEFQDVIWSEEQPYAGTKCIEVSAGKAGVDTIHEAGQPDIHLIPGARYEVGAWFRTENLKGAAGLILAATNLERTKSEVQPRPERLLAIEGTNDWEYASMEFLAPDNTNILRIKTFIEGTGKFWVDDITLSCKADYHITGEILPTERLPVTELGITDQWMTGSSAGKVEWPVRAVVTVPNFTGTALEYQPVYVDIQMLKQRLFAETGDNTLMQLADGTEPIPYLEMGNAILFRQDIPAFTNRTFYLYLSNPDTDGDTRIPSAYSNLSEITPNLVKNPRFDEPGASGWQRFGESHSKVIASDSEEGNNLIRLGYVLSGEETEIRVSDIEESHTATDTEIGLFQEFEIIPAGKYFFSARVRSSDILKRTYTLRAGFLDENGRLIGDKETRRANPDMHQNFQWVSESMIIQAPREARSVRIELVNSVEGDVWYDDVFFMETGTGYTGAMCVERRAAGEVDGIQVWEKDPVAKAFPDDLPGKPVERLFISAAGNDVEPVQLLFRSQESHNGLELKVSPLRDSGGNRLEGIETGMVGYVPISYPSNYIRNFVTPFWQTVLPKGKIGSDGWTGWWPDPILPGSTFDLPANETKAAWIEVSVPPGAVPGIYSGTVSLLQEGIELKKIPLEIQVYGFTLPEENNVKATYVLRFKEQEMFGREYTAGQWKNILWEYMADHRISSKMVEPEPEVSIVNGEPVLDFTRFDKAASYYFDTLKIASTWSPQFFYLFGWGRPPSDKFGQKPYPGEYPYADVDHSKLRPEYKRVYQSALRQYWEHMKEKGWADRTVIYISDEPHADEHMNQQMYAVCDMIHEVDPEIPIYVSTWWYRPEFEGYVDVWGVSHRGGGWGHPVPAGHLQQIRRNGGDIFFTTDGMQCTDSPYLGFERMLPYFCFKYEAKEYEFWAANWHTLDPYNYGWHRFHRQSPSVDVVYWMRYPNGDGNFIYPGALIDAGQPLVPSIRLKQAREGVEDFEFMYMLDKLIGNAEAKGIATKSAEAALQQAMDLVTIPCADGRYTTDYMPDPGLLGEVRHHVALAIEDLTTKLK